MKSSVCFHVISGCCLLFLVLSGCDAGPASISGLEETPDLLAEPAERIEGGDGLAEASPGAQSLTAESNSSVCVPTLVSPTGNQLITTTKPTFVWQAVSCGGSLNPAPTGYELEVYIRGGSRIARVDITYGTPGYSTSGSTNRYIYAGNLIVGGSYQWRVRYNTYSGFSNGYGYTGGNGEFRVGAAPPAAPTVSGSVYQYHPKLTWGAVSGAVSYTVYVRVGGGSWEVASSSVSSTSYVDYPVTSSGLSVGRPSDVSKEVAYRVKAFSSSGSGSSYSTIIYFNKGNTGGNPPPSD